MNAVVFYSLCLHAWSSVVSGAAVVLATGCGRCASHEWQHCDVCSLSVFERLTELLVHVGIQLNPL